MNDVSSFQRFVKNANFGITKFGRDEDALGRAGIQNIRGSSATTSA
jgi:hypothetical protein